MDYFNKCFSDLKACMTDDVILDLNDIYRTTNISSETYPIDFDGMPSDASKTLTIRTEI